jgi:hypothetical protein
MKFVEYVPDYILRNYLKVGQEVTILGGSKIRCQVPGLPERLEWSYTLKQDVKVTLTNFLPGYTEVYTPTIHNHQVVWIGNALDGKPWYYYSTDINNVKEIKDAA